MSVEAPSISSVATGPAIGPGPSFLPSVMEGGASFSPSTGIGNIFSETRSFIASPSVVREGSIGNPSSIFDEGAWTIFKPEPTPVAPFILPDTKPFIGLDFGVKEGPVKIDQGEWVTIAKSSKEKPLETPGIGVLETISSDPNPQDSVKAKEKEDQIRINQIRFALMAEMLSLVQSEGAPVPKKSESRTKPSVKVKTQALIKTEEEGALAYPAAQNGLSPDEEETTSGNKYKQSQAQAEYYPLPVPVVDQLVQGNRKKTTKEKVARAFRISRFIKAPYVSGKEIAPQLAEEKEHKSRLLYQLDAQMFPDGSFDEAVQAIEYLPRVHDLSDKGEQIMQQAAEGVLETNKAVKFADIDFKKIATRRETKRVLKYVLQYLPFV